MKSLPDSHRRNFLIHSATLVGAAALGGAAAFAGCAPQPERAEVTATEDLMRDHGVLQRLLLIYEEMARRLKCCQDFPPSLLTDATSLLRRYIQEHHEKLEEEHAFPILERAGKMVALAKILRLQHEAGRKLLDQIKTQATGGGAKNFVLRAQLEACLLLFSRMYRPHAAREDTLLFPALRTVMTPGEFGDLGRRFESAHPGSSDHFDKVVLEIGEMEKALVINDLEQFTARF
jgi:hemerythrin-like domain-containing protein